MATTSLSLGKHWEDFLEAKVAEGRYGSKSEVIRASLRMLEEHDEKLARLEELLQEGLDSGDAGPLDMAEYKKEARKRLGLTDA